MRTESVAASWWITYQLLHSAGSESGGDTSLGGQVPGIVTGRMVPSPLPLDSASACELVLGTSSSRSVFPGDPSHKCSANSTPTCSDITANYSCAGSSRCPVL